MNNQAPILKTDRLTLRAVKATDEKAIFNLRTNKNVTTFITRNTLKNLSETRNFIDKITQLTIEKKTFFWGIISNQNNCLIGTISIRNFEIQENYAEIGFEIHPDYQQKGLMSEAIKAILHFSKHKLNIKIIEAFTHKNNTASIALLKKHHFIYQTKRRDDGFENNRIWKVILNKTSK